MAILGRRRGSTLAGWGMALLLAALLLVFADAGRLARKQADTMAAGQRLARAARLSDPALFTEARYARNASQADALAAFQDHPLALERFPAGSLMPPPRHEPVD